MEANPFCPGKTRGCVLAFTGLSLTSVSVPVAQLDKASDYESEDCGFKSRRECFFRFPKAKRNAMQKAKTDPRGNRTPNLLIWNQTRYQLRHGVMSDPDARDFVNLYPRFAVPGPVLPGIQYSAQSFAPRAPLAERSAVNRQVLGSIPSGGVFLLKRHIEVR